MSEFKEIPVQPDSFEETRKNLAEKFTNLEYEETMKLPLSMLVPTTIDDGTTSYSEGPILVYQKPNSQEIRISDGHHRFFDKKLRAGINNPKPDYNKVYIDVQKKKYDPENDW